MSRRYLLPLAVAAVLATPLAATAAQGDWLVRVGMSGVDPKESNLENAPGVGGDLVVEWRADDHVILTGPAEFEFSGSLDPATGAWARDRVDA